jgi:hypothetical protein
VSIAASESCYGCGVWVAFSPPDRRPPDWDGRCYDCARVDRYLDDLEAFAEYKATL